MHFYTFSWARTIREYYEVFHNHLGYLNNQKFKLLCGLKLGNQQEESKKQENGKTVRLRPFL